MHRYFLELLYNWADSSSSSLSSSQRGGTYVYLSFLVSYPLSLYLSILPPSSNPFPPPSICTGVFQCTCVRLPIYMSEIKHAVSVTTWTVGVFIDHSCFTFVLLVDGWQRQEVQEGKKKEQEKRYIHLRRLRYSIKFVIFFMRRKLLYLLMKWKLWIN